MRQLQNTASRLPMKTSSSGFLSNFFLTVVYRCALCLRMQGSFYPGVYMLFVYMVCVFAYAPVFMHNIIDSSQAKFPMNLWLFFTKL